MTKFTRYDHDTALRACWDAEAFGAHVTDSDEVVLNRAMASFMFEEAETLSRNEFTSALCRIDAAIKAAIKADPARAARVVSEREEKRAADKAARQHEKAERAAELAAQPKPMNKKARRAAERAARYESDPAFRAQCDKFGTRPGRA